MNEELSHFAFHFHSEPGEETGPVKIGWLLSGGGPAVLYDPPSRVVSRELNRKHAKSASRCPAVLNMETRYFQVNCPFDLHVGFSRDKEGKAGLINRAGSLSPVRGGKLGQILHLANEVEWRYPDRPTVQLSLPYIFIADEPVWVTQLDAFMHYRKTRLPGTIFGGRFPIQNWPRALMWAFEWHDICQDLVLKRGEPLFYLQFEAINPDRPVQLVEAELTDELEEFMKAVSGAVNYANQTFSLFKTAERIRPKTLVTQKKRG